MLIACWSVKGGTGTTVISAALALLLARSGGAVAADLTGDLSLVLGAGSGVPSGVGLAPWTTAGPGVPADALERIVAPVAPGLGLLARGTGPFAVEAAPLLGRLLVEHPRPVVADCGRVDADDAEFRGSLVRSAHRSLLVLRPCYLALRRAQVAPLRPSGVVLVVDEGRSLGARDVEATLGVPVVARVRCTDAVARAVDAGLLTARFPRTLREDLGHVA